MRFNPICILVAAVLSLTTVSATAQSQQTATVSMRPYKDTRAVVAVKLNGAGPYDFLVDTGANVTVLDAGLFAELGLKAEGATKQTTSAGVNTISLATVEEVAVAGLTVRGVKVIASKNLPGVRGILGENFLQHFDILIDNQRREITLDAGSRLAGSFDGERLAIDFGAHAVGTELGGRPTVSVSVPAYGAHPVKLLLDSGADRVTLTGSGTMQPKTSGNVYMVSTVNGSMTCTSGENRLDWGKTSMRGLTLLTCESAAARAQDGLLPTAIFKQIFISHAGSYAIVNPAKRKAGQEIAAADPLIAKGLR